MRTLTDDTPSTEEKPKSTSERPPIRAFNPLVNYLFYAVAVLAAYILYWAIGYPAVIAMMMFFVIQLIRDTIHVNKTYEYKFARQASVINLIYSMTFFIILVINGLALSQQLVPLILPDFQELTAWTPLFIMGGVFGMANIKKMWGPR
jgi:small-conductance mechanosensitive channel